MGFRNKHRRGRGGGGGGGGHHHHHHHGFGTGEPNGLQPGDDIGNRKSFKVVQHPPDDLGNRKDPDEVEFIPVDDVGNRIDAAPTHEMSGTLMDVDGKGRRRRRPKGVAAPERVGRFFVGGVNPLIATNTPRPFPGKTLEESFGGPAASAHGHAPQPSPAHVANDDRGDDLRDAPRDDAGMGGMGDARDDGDFEGEGGRRRRRRGRGGRGGEGRFEQPDGVQAQEVSERRAQRFFDFDEDDRFEYTLKTTAEQKRKDAEDAVKNVVTEAGRDGVVLARLIEDGDRPKILVTIDERGPAASVPAERRAHNANEPLFVMGNAALMSLNYLVNKIVNRYPDDRIRLAILPAADERLYLDALADHQKLRRVPGTATTSGAPGGANGAAAVANKPDNTNNNASVPTPVVATPQPSKPRSVPAVATPAPIGAAAPPEAFDEAMEKPKPVAKEPELAKAEERIAEKVKHLDEAQSEANEAEAEDAEEEEEEQGEEEAEEEESIDSKPKATPKKKAKAAAAPKKKAAATKKAPAKKAAKKAPVVEKATVKKR